MFVPSVTDHYTCQCNDYVCFFFSFIGRGLVDLPPQEVFNCVRNPTQRFTYDNMLKVSVSCSNN